MHMVFIAMLKFFSSTYLRSVLHIIQIHHPPSEVPFDALPTELAGMMQGLSSSIDVYTRSKFKPHKLASDSMVDTFEPHLR